MDTVPFTWINTLGFARSARSSYACVFLSLQPCLLGSTRVPACKGSKVHQRCGMTCTSLLTYVIIWYDIMKVSSLIPLIYTVGTITWRNIHQISIISNNQLLPLFCFSHVTLVISSVIRNSSFLISLLNPAELATEWYHQQHSTMIESSGIAIATTHSVLVIIDIVGNFLVCAIIKKHRDMRYVN